MHYSLFRCPDVSGQVIILDLSKISHIRIDQSNKTQNYYRVSLGNGGNAVLNLEYGDRLLAAWDLYKASYHASFLVEADKEPVAAIKGAFRQDSFLYFEAVDRQRYGEETV